MVMQTLLRVMSLILHKKLNIADAERKAFALSLVELHVAWLACDVTKEVASPPRA